PALARAPSPPGEGRELSLGLWGCMHGRTPAALCLYARSSLAPGVVRRCLSGCQRMRGPGVAVAEHPVHRARHYRATAPARACSTAYGLWHVGRAVTGRSAAHVDHAPVGP